MAETKGLALASDLEVHIPRSVYEKVIFWVQEVDYEVSGLGTMVLEGGTLVVQDAILLPQEGSTAETEISGEAIATAMYRLRDSEGDLRWWWHSHHKMKAFWSGTDRRTLNELGKHGWFTATVFNHAEEQRTAFIQSKPVPLMIDDLGLWVTDPEITPEVKALWSRELEENVKKRQLTPKGPKKLGSQWDIEWPRYMGGQEHQNPRWKTWTCPECGTKHHESTPFEWGDVLHCGGCTTQFEVQEHDLGGRRYQLDMVVATIPHEPDEDDDDDQVPVVGLISKEAAEQYFGDLYDPQADEESP